MELSCRHNVTRVFLEWIGPRADLCLSFQSRPVTDQEPRRRTIVRAIFRVAGVIAAGVLIHSHHIYGQAVTGTIMGAVVDPTRAMVPGAQVTVRSVETGGAKTVTTK